MSRIGTTIQQTREIAEKNRSIIMGIFKKKVGEEVSVRDVMDELKFSKASDMSYNNVYDALKTLANKGDIARIDTTNRRGERVVYILKASASEKKIETLAPKDLGKEADIDKNGEGFKDPTAKAAMSRNDTVSVNAGSVYLCKGNAGMDQLFLVLRDPFVTNDVAKAVVVPVNAARGKEVSCCYNGGKYGKSVDVYPFEIYTKPIKYFTRLYDTLLPCDFNEVKKMVGIFLGTSKETVKTVSTGISAADMELALQKQKAKIYEDMANKLANAFGGAVKEWRMSDECK